jgi:hypothetical protein
MSTVQSFELQGVLQSQTLRIRKEGQGLSEEKETQTEAKSKRAGTGQRGKINKRAINPRGVKPSQPQVSLPFFFTLLMNKDKRHHRSP